MQLFYAYFLWCFWKNTRMSFLLWMLMCTILALTVPKKVMTHCVHLVAQWHLPSHPLASVQDGWWEIWRVATSNMRYRVINVLAGQCLSLTLRHITLRVLVIILKLRMERVCNRKRIYEKLFRQEMFWPIICVLLLSFYLLLFLSLWLFVWHISYRKSPPCDSLFYVTVTFSVAYFVPQVSLGLYI